MAPKEIISHTVTNYHINIHHFPLFQFDMMQTDRALINNIMSLL